jgi:hypothetical protein
MDSLLSSREWLLVLQLRLHFLIYLFPIFFLERLLVRFMNTVSTYLRKEMCGHTERGDDALHGQRG